MLIAQITDLHLGFDPDNPEEFNRLRLDAILDAIARETVRPDIVMASGDLVDRGDEHSYRTLRKIFDAYSIPIYPCLGNHDQRYNFRRVFGDTGFVDGFLQYELEAGPLRILVIDTLEEGRHGGSFCSIRAEWLSARLDEQTDRPTLIVGHHPPTEIGIEWMNSYEGEPWVQRLRETLAGHDQVIGMICGHVHRSISTLWNGIGLSVCASSAPQVALDLRPIDPDTPDDRDMIITDPPSYALHWWNGSSLITHYQTVEDRLTLARFDQRMQPLVRSLIEERRHSVPGKPAGA